MMFGIKVKILIIDDLAENLHAMKMTLKPLENVEIFTAQSGNDGLALMLEHDFAVVLLDVQMPGMDGFETAELMQNHDATRNVPIIFVTAISKEDKHVYKGYRTGAVDYLFKPINPEILLSKVNVFVKLYRQRLEFDRMQQEFQKKKNLEALGGLAGGIAHDFNNLLTTVFGYIQLAQMRSNPESDIFQKLSQAMEGINEAMQLTRQMITFSKGGRPVLERLNVSELLADTCSLLLSGSNVKVKFEISSPVAEIEADKVQISQVFQNLLLNAKEAMADSGTITLKVENITFESDSFNPPIRKGNYVRIDFIDDGPGIDPENLDKIFDPYFSLKSKGATKGQGLGLTIVHSIVMKHGGAIFVESSPGEGATFSTYLPVADRQTQNTVKQENSFESSQATISSRKRKRILVMEDEETLARTFNEILDHLGYETTVVDSPNEAINLFNQAYEGKDPFDAVILELTMHVGEGAETVLAKLKGIDSNVRAIVTDNHVYSTVMVNFKTYGFVAAISRPFSMNDLATTMENVFKE